MCFVWQRALIFWHVCADTKLTPSGEIIRRNLGLNEMMLTCYLWSLSTLIHTWILNVRLNYRVSWSTERIWICF